MNDDREGAPLSIELRVPSLPRIDARVLFPLAGDSSGSPEATASGAAARERHARVFDGWAWCASDVLEWRRPAAARHLDTTTHVDSENPPELAFVFHEDADCTFLPRELARFHARGYGLDEEWALAPYAIDDATDLLYERRVRPREVFWLAASTLRSLVWGLHDWAHFHNHGPFDEPALTELECDLVAMAWLRLNRTAAGLEDADLARVGEDLAKLSRSRFEAEGKPLPPIDLDQLFQGDYPAG